MYKTHAFTQLLDIVERVTEIERADILGHAKNQEIVDARHMFVYALHSLAGLSTAYIAAHTPYSDEGVRKMIVGFDDRYQHSPKLFAILYEQICHAYATN
jgi:hypothetical protein